MSSNTEEEKPFFGTGRSINSKEFREYAMRKMLEPFEEKQKEKEQEGNQK